MKKPISVMLCLAFLLVGVPTVSPAAETVIPDFAELAEKLKPSVVNISSSKRVSPRRPNFPGAPGPYNDLFEEFFERFFEGHPNRPRTESSLGSGVVISSDGYILTNAHVVSGADEINVLMADGRTFAGTVKGSDAKLDLALVKIDVGKEKLPVADLGDSDDLRVGEWVMAIGNPFGLQQTVTVGIVSAKGRVIGAGPYDDFIQTDASINPGNSGGPLISSKGKVVGINTAIVAGGQGIGFAIPINAAKNILPQLREVGHVVRGWLGVTVQALTEELAASFGLKDTQGALVTDVVADSPAAKAGIRRGDVILSINGEPLTEMNDLPRQVAALPIGKPARMQIFRDGKTRKVTVEIGELDAAEGAPSTGDPDDDELTEKGLGLTLSDISPEAARYYGLEDKQGVLVVSVAGDGPAAESGLRPGDLIIEVNGRSVENVADLRARVSEIPADAVLRLLVQRSDQLFYTTLERTAT